MRGGVLTCNDSALSLATGSPVGGMKSLDGFSAVAESSYGPCALDSNGAIRCWDNLAGYMTHPSGKYKHLVGGYSTMRGVQEGTSQIDCFGTSLGAPPAL